jgi:NAD-dependent SIR2 family protein deacetylase
MQTAKLTKRNNHKPTMRLVDVTGNGFFVSNRSKELLRGFFSRKSSLCFVGAGVSIPAGVPGGAYFKRAIQEVTGNRSDSWNLLVKDLRKNRKAYERIRTWFVSVSREAEPTVAHQQIIRWWTIGNMRAVITTNWDFLLEEAWRRNFGKKGLFVCCSDGDLRRAKKTREKTILHKIHGSPLFHTCPRCRGVERFKFIDPRTHIKGSIFCSIHHEELNDPAMILPTECVDASQKEVWNQVLTLAKRASNILVMGYSGNDKYIFDEFMKPNKDKIYVIKPLDSSPIEGLVREDRLYNQDANSFLLELGLIQSDSSERHMYGPGGDWWDSD